VTTLEIDNAGAGPYNEYDSFVKGCGMADTVTVTAMGKPRRVQSEEVRRTQILASARTLIAEQGYERTTTAQIAKRAGISEGTIYNYFPSKVAIISALKEQAMRAVLDGGFARARPDMQGSMLIRAMLEGAFAAAHENADLMRAFTLTVELREHMHGDACEPEETYENSVEELRQFFSRQQETGMIPRSVDLAVMSRLILGTVDRAMDEVIVGGHTEQEATYIDLMVRMFSRALYVE